VQLHVLVMSFIFSPTPCLRPSVVPSRRFPIRLLLVVTKKSLPVFRMLLPLRCRPKVFFSPALFRGPREPPLISPRLPTCFPTIQAAGLRNSLFVRCTPVDSSLCRRFAFLSDQPCAPMPRSQLKDHLYRAMGSPLLQ